MIRFAVELEHARVKGLCPSGRRRCSKSRHSKCAILRALAFEETRRAKNILNIWRNRKEWVHDTLAFSATVYVLFFPFQGIAKLALGIGLFKFKYLTQCGSGKTTERSPPRGFLDQALARGVFAEASPGDG